MLFLYLFHLFHPIILMQFLDQDPGLNVIFCPIVRVLTTLGVFCFLLPVPPVVLVEAYIRLTLSHRV